MGYLTFMTISARAQMSSAESEICAPAMEIEVVGEPAAQSSLRLDQHLMAC